MERIDRPPQQSIPERERERLSTRVELCERLRGDDTALEELLTEMTSVPRDELWDRRWNTPLNYLDLVVRLFPHLTAERHEPFVSAMNAHAKRPGLKGADIKGLAEALRSAQVCAGTKIAEIGGMFTKDCFGSLGAIVHAADAGFDGLNPRTPLLDARQLVTRDNYRTFFPDAGTYDAVCTNNVITAGSGFDAAAQQGGLSYYDLLRIEHDLVRNGGVIANVVDRIHPRGVERAAQGNPDEYSAFVAAHPKQVRFLS